MKRYLRDYAFLFSVAGVIIILDQITKNIVRSQLALGEIWAPWDWIIPYARIIHIGNTGVAFGMFQGMGDVFKIVSLLVSIAVIYYFPHVPRSESIVRLALSMQLGGAVGNLIDRFAQGYVTDFVSIGTFPVWNVADASITVGVGVLLLGIWLQERREKQAARLAEIAEIMKESPEPPAADNENVV